MTNAELIAKARSVIRPRDTTDGVQLGYVGCALLTTSGNIHAGVSIHAYCGIGFCAEHSAIAAMVTAGEQRIEKLVAVASDGTVVAPCGRCRELILQLDEENAATLIVLADNETQTVKNLLPRRWKDIE